MNKPLYQFFASDHHRIEALLEKSTADFSNIDKELYHQFRSGLLTHIKMEEKTLFPAAQEANGGKVLPEFKRLRSEHGALTALMVPAPSEELVRVIRYVLEQHDEKEEKPGGIYDVCEALNKDRTQEILEKLRKVTTVPVHPHNEKPYVIEVAKRALARAGFDYDKIIES